MDVITRYNYRKISLEFYSYSFDGGWDDRIENAFIFYDVNYAREVALSLPTHPDCSPNCIRSHDQVLIINHSVRLDENRWE